jgi:hypothetical protein
LGTGAHRNPNEVHVDLSDGIVSTWDEAKVRTVLAWVLGKQGYVTRMDGLHSKFANRMSACLSGSILSDLRSPINGQADCVLWSVPNRTVQTAANGLALTSGSSLVMELDRARQNQIQALDIRRIGEVAAMGKQYEARMARRAVPGIIAGGVGSLFHPIPGGGEQTILSAFVR